MSLIQIAFVSILVVISYLCSRCLSAVDKLSIHPFFIYFSVFVPGDQMQCGWDYGNPRNSKSIKSRLGNEAFAEIMGIDDVHSFESIPDLKSNEKQNQIDATEFEAKTSHK